MQLRPRQQTFVEHCSAALEAEGNTLGVMSRAAAKATGAQCYSTGQPCVNGHPPRRYASNGKCVGCQAAHNRKPVLTGEAAARRRAFYASQPARAKATQRRYVERNRDTVREIARNYYRNHPGNFKARAREREAMRLKATPAWADRHAIRSFYRACPPEMHVDHVIPLKGKTVCGLHVGNNLQYLPEAENRAKGNRWEASDAA